MRYAFYLLLLGSFLIACRNGGGESAHSPEAQTEPLTGHGHGAHNHANHHMNQRPIEDMVENFESPERDEWQKPDTVVAFLGDLKGLTVMDLGSGSGYFSFRLARAGARVIAADADERFLAYIEQRKEEEGWTGDQVETRKVPYDSPALKEAEVDLFFTVNVYHHIDDRPAYFVKVKKGLKPGGRVVILDFFKKELPVGPPVEMKQEPETVVEELKAAGFTDIRVEENLLPYQYIVTAR